MMLVYWKEGEFHIVRILGRSGMSITATSYCGMMPTAVTEVPQVPEKYFNKLCKKCWERTRGQ